jgi:hypothetical protein
MMHISFKYLTAYGKASKTHFYTSFLLIYCYYFEYVMYVVNVSPPPYLQLLTSK